MKLHGISNGIRLYNSFELEMVGEFAMACKKGMKGFSHTCDTKKIKLDDFKMPLRESSFSCNQVAVIWDFYVTRTFTGSSRQPISLENYGWDAKEKDLKDIEAKLMSVAGIEKLCCIRASSIKNTLAACDLSDNFICVEHPRIVLKQKYSVSVDENEKMKFSGGEKRINCLFRHIRNSLAHSNTYFFENGNVLLEDIESKKNGKKEVSARILIKQQTLLDWIKVIDKEEKYYTVDEVCDVCIKRC